MRRSNRSMLLAAGAFAVAVLSMPALARDNTTTELSAQGMSPANPNAPPPRGAPRAAPRQAPARVAPVQRAAPVQRTAPVQRAAPRQAPVRVAPVQRAAPMARPQNIQRPPRTNVQRNIGAPPPRVVAPIAPPAAGPRIIATPRQGNRAFTPRGANSNVVRAARIRGVPMRGVGRTSIQGRNYSVWRSNYRVRRGGGWRTFVALGALGTIAVGAAEYYPYAYIQAPERYCDGRTEDGCQLVWEDVETVEGGTYGQCVAYCPWQ
jgi:cell wall-associated NlpC family hydrolase